MRRMMVLGVLAIVLVIGSATIGQAGGDVREPSSRQRSSGVEAQMVKLERWADRYSIREKVSCDTLKCLNGYLSRLSKDTEAFEDFVNGFINTWNSCFRVNPLTRYGSLDNTFGYIFDVGDGTTFKVTALDYSFDPTTEPFRYFMSWRIAAACPVGEPA